MCIRDSSTTTKLKGEAIFAIADVFGDEVEGLDGEVGDAETTFSSRVRLNFDTSFFGKDRLRTRLQGGNFVNIDDDITGTDSTRLGFDSGGDFDINVTDLHYRFPFGERFTGYVGAFGLDLNDIFAESNPTLASSGSGALSRFSRRNPLVLRGTEGAGAGVNFDIIPDKVGINFGYLADDAGADVEDDGSITPGGAPDPNGSGLFGGSFSAGAQVEFSPIEAFAINATYVRSFDEGGTDFSNGTVSGFADDPFNGADTTADRFGLGANFNLGERIVLAGFAGYAEATGIVDGDDNDLEGEILTWSANISFLDLVKEGSQLSIAGGLLPKFTSDDAVAEGAIVGPGEIDEDRDNSYLIEALYRFPLNDNIDITPGAYVVFNANHIEDNDEVYVGVIRTTFKF